MNLRHCASAPQNSLILLLALVACQGSGADDPDMSMDPPSNGVCMLSANTSATTTVNTNGCAVLTRNTDGCKAARMAAGLSGVWLKFSCRVNLSKNGNVSATGTADGQPDYKSFYFSTNHPCYQAWPQGTRNPNTLSAKSYTVSFPASPNTTATSMNGNGVVGLAVNGIPIFGNFAAPGDDIFQEAMTFDKCGGHPQNSGSYHYHSEPYAITQNDANLVGVLRDGYPLYGRKDADGSTPTLDEYGGHTSVTADSAGQAVYHYHVNPQTSTNAGTLGQTQYFLTKGSWRGSPGTCTGC